jgi:hypothetical protein
MATAKTSHSGRVSLVGDHDGHGQRDGGGGRQNWADSGTKRRSRVAGRSFGEATEGLREARGRRKKQRWRPTPRARRSTPAAAPETAVPETGRDR